jgi:hypothetical protein
MLTRVARVFISIPKMPILVYFLMHWDRRCLVYFVTNWYFNCNIGIFYGHLVFLLPFWHIFSILVCCKKKNLDVGAGTKQTLISFSQAKTVIVNEGSGLHF